MYQHSTPERPSHSNEAPCLGDWNRHLPTQTLILSKYFKHNQGNTDFNYFSIIHALHGLCWNSWNLLKYLKYLGIYAKNVPKGEISLQNLICLRQMNQNLLFQHTDICKCQLSLD
jgi:hypothetical protein